MKLLTAIAFFLAAAKAEAGCEELAGKYRGVADEAYSSDFSRAEFGITERGGGARISLWPDGSDQPRRLDIILDGQEHPGDGAYTGKSYVAFCEEGALTVRASFPEQPDPLLYYFYEEEAELKLVNAVGSYSRLTGRFTRL
ncbi:MAG: hypothetical protein EOP11_07700 [Proteobacteria bacterium]|nr:MAG: hypothetical protein EOP11_07700 [Pseudomonadota bacterium]